MRMNDQLFLPGFAPILDESLGFVYVGARGSNNIASCQLKIGHSQRDPLGRVRRLRLKLLVLMPGTLADERALHQRFSAARIDREWFLPTPDLLAFIAETAKTTAETLSANAA